MKTENGIKKLRLGAGMSQDELASRLFVSRTLVAKWEAGSRRPDRETLLRIADIFGADATEILDEPGDVMRELGACIPAGSALPSDSLPALLDSFLLNLSERERNVFVRRYHFLESRSQIGQRYGLSEGNVGIILFRTRRRLKEYLKGVKE